MTHSKRFLIRLSIVGSTCILALVLTTSFLVKNYTENRLRRFEPPYPTVFTGEHFQADIILFGDSRAANWGTDALLSLGSVANAGIRGDVTASMLSRLRNDALLKNPKFVVLVAGINDVVTASLLPTRARENILSSTKRNLDHIVELTIESGARLIIVTVSPPLNPDMLRRLIWGNTIESDVESLNQHLSKYALNDKVFLVDTLAVFKQYGDDWIDAIRRDSLHYSRTAYDLLDQAVIEAISSQGGA